MLCVLALCSDSTEVIMTVKVTHGRDVDKAAKEADDADGEGDVDLLD